MGRSRAITTEHRAPAQAALAGALTLARRGTSAPLRDQRHGERLDTRRLARVATGDLRIFTRRGAPAPNRIRVSILIDASSSMGAMMRIARWDYQTRAQVCCQIARDLAGATDLLPWVTADVSAFTTNGGDVVTFPLWRTGQPTSYVDVYGSIPMGGTEEGYALAFARDEMLEARQGREQALIIIISDGGPSEPVHVKSVVDTCRKDGIPVVSVALVTSAAQPAMYGPDNVIEYDGSPIVLARRMAQAIGRVL